MITFFPSDYFFQTSDFFILHKPLVLTNGFLTNLFHMDVPRMCFWIKVMEQLTLVVEKLVSIGVLLPSNR